LHSESPYVDQDAYFDVKIGEIEPPTELSISQIRQEQESVVVRQLADGLSPVQWDALSTLVTDGGEVSPDDIAESGGWHVESVRRALREMNDLVERKYAEVGLRSDYVAEMVHDAVQEAEQAVGRAVETAADAMENAERAVNQSMSAWLAFCDKHDIDVSDRKDMKLKFRENEESLSFKLMEARRIWREAGQEPHRLQAADVIVGGVRKGSVSQLSLKPPD
jgi:predicted transcriptional regulator